MAGACLAWGHTVPRCSVEQVGPISTTHMAAFDDPLLFCSRCYFKHLAWISLLHLKSRIAQCRFFFLLLVGDLVVTACREELFLVVAVCCEYRKHHMLKRCLAVGGMVPVLICL